MTKKTHTLLAVAAWLTAAALVLGDGADNHLSEAGRAGYLVGMMASALSLAAWLKHRLGSTEAVFEYGRRASEASLGRDRA